LQVEAPLLATNLIPVPPMANKKNKRVSKNKKKQLNKKKPSLGEQKLSKKDRDVINLMEDVDTTG